MALLADEDLAAIARKRAQFRVITAGTKLNKEEVAALETYCREHSTNPGELIRQLILREIAANEVERKPSTELVELVGLRLFLTNVLKPIVTGQRLTSDLYEAILAEVRRSKREVATQIQSEMER